MESTIDFEKKEGHIDDHSKSDSAGSSIPAFSRQAHCRRRNPICRVSRQDACSGREGAHHRLAAVEFVLDNTPFMNMLYVLEGERGNGRGRQLVSHWEALMKAKGVSACNDFDPVRRNRPAFLSEAWLCRRRSVAFAG